MVLASVILLFLGIALQHWCTTAPLVFPHLAKNAEAYFEAQGRALSFSYEAGHVRGGYMASLLYDYNSETYYIGLFERDSLFHGRWRCCGGFLLPARLSGPCAKRRARPRAHLRPSLAADRAR